MASLRNLTVAEIRRELERREKGGRKLLARRAKVAAELAGLDAELAALGVQGAARPGRKPGRKPGRPAKAVDGRSRRAKNSLTLLQAILAGVAVGKTVSPAQAAVAARKAGYKSASKTFGVMVSTCLAKAREFKRTGRGQYLRLAAKAGALARAARKAGRKAVRKAGRKPGRKPGKARAAKAATPAAGAPARPVAAKAEAAAGA